MDIQAIREKALNTPLKIQPVPTPFWDGTDGSVYLQDIPTDELIGMEDLKKAPNGNALYTGALLCRALVARNDAGVLERIFQDTDRETVAKLGSAMLSPVFNQVQQFFGIQPNAAAQAKNA